MLNLYQSMAEGRSAVQRKFATMYSKYLVQCIECNETAIMRIVELLFKDKDENNKIYLVDTVIELSRSKPVPALQPYFNLISYQFAWRIRYELIAKIERLAEAIGKDSFKFFMAYYVKYINDIDPEIRSIAILKLQDLVRYLESEEIVNRILPALKNAVQDNESYVRRIILHT